MTNLGGGPGFKIYTKIHEITQFLKDMQILNLEKNLCPLWPNPGNAPGKGVNPGGDGGDISPPCFDMGGITCLLSPPCFDPQICCSFVLEN